MIFSMAVFNWFMPSFGALGDRIMCAWTLFPCGQCSFFCGDGWEGDWAYSRGSCSPSLGVLVSW